MCVQTVEVVEVPGGSAARARERGTLEPRVRGGECRVVLKSHTRSAVQSPGEPRNSRFRFCSGLLAASVIPSTQHCEQRCCYLL